MRKTDTKKALKGFIARYGVSFTAEDQSLAGRGIFSPRQTGEGVPQAEALGLGFSGRYLLITAAGTEIPQEGAFLKIAGERYYVESSENCFLADEVLYHRFLLRKCRERAENFREKEEGP